MKSRKIGVLTLGVSMVTFGVLFLLRMFISWFDYLYVMKFWPVILVLLGLEVLVSAILPMKEGESRPRLDALSVILLFLTLFLAFILAAAQMAFEHVPAFLERMAW